MSSAYARRLSGAVLLVFFASLGASIFHVKRLAHELGDGIATFAQAVDSSHGPAHPVPRGSLPVDDSDHELLHAAAHIQPCPFLAFDWPATAPSGAVQGSFIASAVAHAARDAPFRPPRIPSSST